MRKAALALSAALIASIAQTTAGNAAPVVAGTYFEDTAEEVNCQAVATCQIVFSTLPQLSSAYFLTVTHISCILFGTRSLNSGYLEITDNGSNPRRRSAFNLNTPVGNATFREELQMKISGGPPRQLRAVVQNSTDVGSYNLTCKLVGVISPS